VIQAIHRDVVGNVSYSGAVGTTVDEDYAVAGASMLIVDGRDINGWLS
jgi:hypothetical protein